MSYQHDVFISYRRQELWTSWTRDHFKKLLRAYLQQDLQRDPDIFVDERIQVGADWVDSLGEHLATSRAMVAIFSADYFASDWCLHELDLMLARSNPLSKRKPSYIPLLIPVIVHDGEHIPKEAKRIQPADMAKFRIAYIQESSPDYMEFSKAMAQLAPQVANVIRAAPDFKTTWVKQSRLRFNQVFEASSQNKELGPKNFKAIRPAPPLAPPRARF